MIPEPVSGANSRSSGVSKKLSSAVLLDSVTWNTWMCWEPGDPGLPIVERDEVVHGLPRPARTRTVAGVRR